MLFRWLSSVFWLSLLASVVCGQDFDEFYRRGELARVRGEFENARLNFASALERGGDAKQKNLALVGLGHIDYLQANYVDAISRFRDAESIGDDRGKALARAYLGQLYWRFGKVDDGAHLLREALKGFETLGDDAGRALTLRFFGRLENGRAKPGTNLPNNELAIQHLERALLLYRKLGDVEGELTTLKEIGIVHQSSYYITSGFETARPFFREVRDRTKNSDFKRLYALALNNLSTNAFSLGELELSTKYCDEALAMFRAMGDDQEALEMLQRKIELASNNRAQFAASKNIIDDAFQLAYKLYSKAGGNMLDRRVYFDSMWLALHYKSYYGVFMRRPDEIVEVQEEMRSKALIDKIRTVRGETRPRLNADDKRDGDAIDEEIRRLNRRAEAAGENALESQIWRARLLKEEWEARMAAKYARASPVDEPRRPIAELCRDVPDSDSAFVYFESYSTSYVRVLILTRRPPVEFKFVDTEEMPGFAVDAGDGQPCTVYSVYPLGAGTMKDVEKTERTFRDIGTLRDAISGNLPAFRESSRAVYDAILAPVSPILKGIRRLVLIPSGRTTEIPFEALLDADGRYLIEDYEISYAPSIRAFRELRLSANERADRRYAGDFIGLGNPRLTTELVAKQRTRYRDGKLTDLPEAAVETRTIAKLFNRADVRTGAEATESAWRAGLAGYRILHVASHGLSDSHKPLYSHLLLGADPADDGLVEGWEIADADIPAAMVVLSACETANGPIIGSEGAIGLVWAFQAAGVPTVVASRWKVDSAVTSREMIDFYRNLRIKKQSPAAALRAAALKIMKNPATSHPFYWSAFSLYGIG